MEYSHNHRQQRASFHAIFICFLFVFLSVHTSWSHSVQALPQQKAVPSLMELSGSLELLAEKVSPAVVQIFVTGYDFDSPDGSRSASLLTRQRISGSGVILDNLGHIVTNAHVVQGARRIQVLAAAFSENQCPGLSIVKAKGKLVLATIVGVDQETDLAVLKIEGIGFPFLPLGDSDSLKAGQLVLAFGSPLGLENSVTMGVVSAVGRQLVPEGPMIYVQTDASINPGNSGGPLINMAGQVVGINTAILSQSGGNEGVGFAAPSNIVRNVFEQILKTGRVQRGEIGVFVQTATPTLAYGLHLFRDWGVVVADVTPHSPASMVGLRVGDLILELDGKVLENGRQFDVNLYRRAFGEIVTLEVLRGSERMSFQVPVVERPDDSERLTAMISPENNLVPALGIFAIDLNERTMQLLPSLREGSGIVVAAKAADAPYFAEELQSGDVIHSINGESVKNVEQLRTILEGLQTSHPVVLQVERFGQLRFVSFELE
ncbi:trypsin-like peptidase domain-containing protein [bacterium]|nr:trypsin-like peptidase domain-containing protein [bacterium]